MATAKKAPVKRKTTSTTKKAAPAKKSVAQNTTSRKKVSKSKKPEYTSFHIVPDPEPFLTFKVTRQTFYWLVLSVIIVSMASWILKLQAEVTYLYDQVDSSNQETAPIVPKKTTTNE